MKFVVILRSYLFYYQAPKKLNILYFSQHVKVCEYWIVSSSLHGWKMDDTVGKSGNISLTLCLSTQYGPKH